MRKSRRKIVGRVYSSAKGEYVIKRVRQRTHTGDSRAKMLARGARRQARHMKHVYAGCDGKSRGSSVGVPTVRFCSGVLPEGQRLGDRSTPSKPWRNRKKSDKKSSTTSTPAFMAPPPVQKTYTPPAQTSRTDEPGRWGDSYRWW